jgi:hypothetical protein
LLRAPIGTSVLVEVSPGCGSGEASNLGREGLSGGRVALAIPVLEEHSDPSLGIPLLVPGWKEVIEDHAELPNAQSAKANRPRSREVCGVFPGRRCRRYDSLLSKHAADVFPRVTKRRSPAEGGYGQGRWCVSIGHYEVDSQGDGLPYPRSQARQSKVRGNRGDESR